MQSGSELVALVSATAVPSPTDQRVAGVAAEAFQPLDGDGPEASAVSGISIAPVGRFHRLEALIHKVLRAVVYLFSFEWVSDALDALDNWVFGLEEPSLLGGPLAERKQTAVERPGEEHPAGPLVSIDTDWNSPVNRPREATWSDRQRFLLQRGERGLSSIDLKCQNNPGGGNCFFHSISYCIHDVLTREPARKAQLIDRLNHWLGVVRERLQAQPGQVEREVLSQIETCLAEGVRSVQQDQLIPQQSVRGWMAAILLFEDLEPRDNDAGRADYLAAVQVCLLNLGRSEDFERLRLEAGLSTLQNRVWGIIPMIQALSYGALEGTIGQISEREVMANRNREGRFWIPSEQARQRATATGQPGFIHRLVVEDHGQAGPRVFVVHQGAHFYSARMPAPRPLVVPSDSSLELEEGALALLDLEQPVEPSSQE
jgi:hypothetical protein